MIGNKKILVVVPARGGSKGIKLKNIQSVNGVPLVAMTGQIVQELDMVDRAIVSTDHEEIANVAKENGLNVPFLRPEYLSGDSIGDLEVLEHALTEMEKHDNTIYDIVVMLQPTSPARTAKHVSDTINKLIDTNADSVWSLSLTDSKAHPYKQLIIDKDEIGYYDKEGANIIARQQLKPTYHKNGIAYAITRDCILNQKSIKGRKCVPLLIEEYVSNIDTEIDIAFAEFLIKYYENYNRSI
jgi:CMP-N,N'-diacetyllegionaminic acid synthase